MQVLARISHQMDERSLDLCAIISPTGEKCDLGIKKTAHKWLP